MRRFLGLAGACVVAVALVIYVAKRFDAATDGTDEAAWIEAIATVAALAAAVAAAIFAGRVYVLEERRDQRLISDQRQFQAARVAAWVKVEPLTIVQQGIQTRASKLLVHLRNASDLPVTNVKLTLQLSGVSREGGRQVEWGDDLSFDILPPADAPEIHEVRSPKRFADAWRALREDPPRSVRVALEFRDTNNVVWVRYADGSLEEMRDTEHPR